MVIDRLENIEKYTLLHPLFEQAIDFLKSHDLHSLTFKYPCPVRR